MVLLVVDTQKQITNKELYNFELFVSNVKKLIKTARENNIEVIYIRHDDGSGQELTRGTDGFEIYDEFEPDKDEKIFDKTVNSPFRDTGLLEYLTGKQVKQIIVTGLQTDYCIDATVKCGFEHGFRMVVPEETNSTFDNQYMSAKETYEYYNNFMWKGRYANCISMKEVLELMKSCGGNIFEIGERSFGLCKLKIFPQF